MSLIFVLSSVSLKSAIGLSCLSIIWPASNWEQAIARVATWWAILVHISHFLTQLKLPTYLYTKCYSFFVTFIVVLAISSQCIFRIWGPFFTWVTPIPITQLLIIFLSWGISTTSWNQTWNHSRLSLIYTGRKLWNVENSDDERNDGFASAWIVLELRAVSLVFAESPLCHLSKADQREYQCYTRIMSRLHQPSHSRVFHVGGPAHPTRPRSPTMKHLTHPACLTADNSTQRVQLCNAQCTAE